MKNKPIIEMSNTRTLRSSNWLNLSSNNVSTCSNNEWGSNRYHSRANNTGIIMMRVLLKCHINYNKEGKCKGKERQGIINNYKGWILVERGNCDRERTLNGKTKALAGSTNTTICTLGTSLRSCTSIRLWSRCTKRRCINIVISPCQGRIITLELRKSLRFKLIRTLRTTSETSMPTCSSPQ